MRLCPTQTVVNELLSMFGQVVQQWPGQRRRRRRRPPEVGRQIADEQAANDVGQTFDSPPACTQRYLLRADRLPAMASLRQNADGSRHVPVASVGFGQQLNYASGVN